VVRGSPEMVAYGVCARTGKSCPTATECIAQRRCADVGEELNTARTLPTACILPSGCAHPLTCGYNTKCQASAQLDSTGTPPPHDPVNHPKHYTSHPSGVECITITEHMGFLLGNTMKYLWRAGLKPGTDTLQDLRKARWYLDRQITQLEKDPST
jgi:hypothetical protein